MEGRHAPARIKHRNPANIHACWRLVNLPSAVVVGVLVDPLPLLVGNVRREEDINPRNALIGSALFSGTRRRLIVSRMGEKIR